MSGGIYFHFVSLVFVFRGTVKGILKFSVVVCVWCDVNMYTAL